MKTEQERNESTEKFDMQDNIKSRQPAGGIADGNGNQNEKKDKYIRPNYLLRLL